MEIIRIRMPAKDSSELDWYPNDFSRDELDLSEFEAFLSWAVAIAKVSGEIQLDCSAYDKAVELLGTDDLQCPRSLVVEFQDKGAHYVLSIPFDRASTKAYLSSMEPNR